ncbi:hypothetical protein [Methanobrevibacter sp. DSM 116169]|uniref:hypothetical protein n=1 Tax=Methanobrevibacter sp. DSM 116169 TaxID=3242727 RepID=UPI0038FC2FD0
METIDFIENELKMISKKYGMTDIELKYEVDDDEIDEVFYIYAPNTLSIDEKHDKWDKIVREIESFCKEKEIYDTLLRTFIIVK